MIAGVGVDLCDISRMEGLLRDGKFLKRFFSEEEQAYILNKGKFAAQTMAGVFAAKEALMKALGTGIGGGAIADIRVLHDGRGAPYYDLRGEYTRIAAEKKIASIYVSITHEGGMAAAVAVAEREP